MRFGIFLLMGYNPKLCDPKSHNLKFQNTMLLLLKFFLCYASFFCIFFVEFYFVFSRLGFLFVAK